MKKAEIRQGPAGSTVPFRRIVYDGGSGNGMGRVTRIDYGPFDLITDAPKLRESFSYTPAGLIAGRSVALRTYSSTYTTVGASFVHDNEGRRVRVNYPAGVTYSDGAWRQDPAISYENAFDAKGQISTMTEKNSVYGDTAVASGVIYNLAGQMTAATVFGTARTWQYNDRGQLTREAAAGMMDFTYTFDAAQNDGRVKTRADAISGETVTYLYDKLGRLSSATATGAGVAWSQSFTHDGFANLTQLTGSGTNLSLTVNDRNQITSGGASYDANGNRQSINGHNLGYDFENRLTSVTNVLFNDPNYQGYGTETYGYSVRGERLLVEHSPSGGSTPPYREVRLYDPAGGLMGAYTFAPTCEAPCMPSFYVIEKHEKRRVYFAGRLVKVGTQIVATDRLGSVIALREQAYPNPVTRYRYYPYGEAIGTQEWDKPQFATYTRDGSSGLDDAMNRQYDRIWGRFTSPDPYQASGGPADPGSWNRYVYVQGDPVNYQDPEGLKLRLVTVRTRLCFYVMGQLDSCEYDYQSYWVDDGTGGGGGSSPAIISSVVDANSGGRSSNAPSTPTDPLKWVSPLPTPRPTNNYGDYLKCVAAEWGLAITQDLPEWVLLNLAPYAAAKRGLWNMLGLSPRANLWSLLAFAAANDILKALEIQAKCTTVVYGADPSNRGSQP